MRHGAILIGGLAVLTALWAPSMVEGLVLLPIGTFEIVPGDSSVVFRVPDNRGGFSGRTTQVTGRVAVRPWRSVRDQISRRRSAISRILLSWAPEDTTSRITGSWDCRCR